MSKQYPGGIVSKTPVTPTSLSAPGIWTMNQQAAAQATNTWPFPRDPQFPYVTMLLHGDGSAGPVAATGVGAGVSTTVTNFNADASTNNFNVTINGDARSNNFNPYLGDGYYSNFFDGTGDYLTYPPLTTNQFGTGSFTIEAWYYPLTDPSGANAANIYDARTASVTSSWVFGCRLNGSGSGNLLGWYNGSAVLEGSALTLNTWNHIVYVRDSGTNTGSLFLNGTRTATQTDSTNYSSTGATATIGSRYTVDGFINGYLSNLRLVKGTAVYSASSTTITVPTTPLTAITNTSLLTCQSNRFIDNSTNAFTITKNGDTLISPAIPFTLPTTVATYGSGYFDGTGDYLNLNGQATFAFGSSASFTIQFWFYATAISADVVFYDGRPTTTQGLYPTIYLNNTTKVVSYVTNSTEVITGSTTIVTGQWYYVTLSRNSGSTRLFVNGVQQGSTYADTITYANPASRPTIMQSGYAANGYLTGYVTDFQVINGTGYSSVTVPTSPLTAITNTSLLTTQYNGGGNNSGFKDSSQFNFPITRNGNTTQGTFTPYGSNWSNYFDGTGDTLNTASNAAFGFGSGSWTLEAFVYPTVAQTDNWIIATNDAGKLRMRVGASGYLSFFTDTGSVSLNSTTVVTVNAWSHVAICYDGTTLSLFQNGTRTATSTVSISNGSANACYIGSNTIGGSFWNGYISNARVVKGTAVYSGATYTVPTAPLTAITNTSLLTCADNRFIDDSTNNFTITKSGDVSVQRFSPFAPLTVYNPTTYGGSMYLDGTTDFVKTPSDASLSSTLLASNFTIECWIYLAAYPSSGAAIWTNSVTNADGFTSSYINSNGTVGTGKVNVNEFNTTTTIKLNTWTHFALVRNSGTLYVYFNGVQDATTGAASTYLNTSATKPMQIGSSNQSPPTAMQGYMSDFRVVASAVYTTGFTPNTAPLTAISGTNLLLNTTNPAILDNAMLNNLETVGNAAVSTSVKKYGAASMYFDGTGDYLSTPDNPALDMGSANFTIEGWVYVTATSVSLQTLVAKGTGANNQASYHIALNGSTWVYYLSGTGSSWSIASGVTIGTYTINTWQHIALVRNGSTFTPYLNGVAGTTTTSSTALFDSNKPFTAGADDAGTSLLTGYIDELRVTKGVARYTAAFTVPDQAFPNG